MEVLIATIMMIGLVVISNIISHYLVAIPTALIEIAIGLAVALSFDIRIEMQADWFMLLFVAPLLFNDGKFFPKDELWELRTPIFANAIWLVLLTTVLGGYFVHWLIPGIPLALAMALVAVLSPTDPVAVHGIAEQIHLPKKLLSLISGESLINDASGLIAFKYALAAFMTGTFSLSQATGDFLYMAIIGGLIGILMISTIHLLRLFLVQQGIQDVILHTTIQLITPFLIYIVADELAHTSGVIAVVAAGVMSIKQPPIFRSQHSEVKLVTTKMWDVLVYLLNGLVFILLGLELPLAMRETIENPMIHNTTLLFYIVSIWLFLLVSRVGWSYSYMWLTYLNKDNDKDDYPSFKLAVMTGLTGVRGAVTMASIMSMPFLLPSGALFVQRPLLVTLACGVVLTSLLVATITLPLLTKQPKRLALSGDGSDSDDLAAQTSAELTELEARQLMVKHAILLLKEESLETKDYLVISDLIQEFESRLRHLYREHNDEETNRLYSQLEKLVQEVAIAGELAGIEQLISSGEVSPRAGRNYRKLIIAKKEAFEPGFLNFLKRMALVLRRQGKESGESGFLNSLKRMALLLRRQGNLAFWRWKLVNVNDDVLLGDLSLIKLDKASTRMAINYLKAYKKDIDPNTEGLALLKHITNQKHFEYIHKLHRIKHLSTHSKSDYHLLLQEYYMKALDAERETVQGLYQKGKINLTMANHLRQSLNYYESSILQNSQYH